MGQSASQSAKVENIPVSTSSPQFVKLSRVIRRSKLTIQFLYFFEFLSFLIIALFSIFQITTSDTFSQLWLFNIGHFHLSLYAFFISRELTNDMGIFVGFVVMTTLYGLADIGVLIWRYILIVDCRNDPTRSVDCNSHLWASDLILSLNWVLIFIDIIYFITGLLVAIYSKPVINAFSTLLDIAKVRLYNQPPQQQIIVQPAPPTPVTVNISSEISKIVKIETSSSQSQFPVENKENFFFE